LKEKVFEILGIDPLLIFGANNSKLTQIKKYFPGVKLVARGNVLTAIGDDERLDLFEKKKRLHSLMQKQYMVRLHSNTRKNLLNTNCFTA
jgi:hypothetical protein